MAMRTYGVVACSVSAEHLSRKFCRAIPVWRWSQATKRWKNQVKTSHPGVREKGRRVDIPDEGTSRRAAQQDIVVAVLASNGSYAEAAEAAEVDPRTIGRWMQQAPLRRRVNDARQEHVIQLHANLALAAPHAVEVLLEVARDEYEKGGPRVSAADALLRHNAKIHELDVLQAQIDELREATEGFDSIGELS